MPIYEYQCQACGHVLDALQKFDDAPLRKCPDCGKPKLKRLMSAPMFLLKGTGWYETDFKSEKEAKRNLADRPEPDKKEAEAKPETKADGGEKAADKTEKTDKAAKKDEKTGTPAAGKPVKAPAGKGGRRSAGARAPRKAAAQRKARRR